MTSEQLSVIAGIVLSLAFSYVPVLHPWFQSLDGVYKRLIMLLSLFIVSCFVVALSCVGWFDFVTCDKFGFLGILVSFVLAAVANQTAFQLSPQIKS